MDLLFNPSLGHETFSIANIEAMAAGVPVAAYGIGGMLEYLIHDENALVLDNADPRASAADIAALLRNPARRGRLSSRARQQIKAHFGWETSIKRWADLYEALGRS